MIGLGSAWEKFQVLASIQGWDSEAKRTKHLPLFLEGDAFLVFTRMAEADKKKEKEILRKMEQSFALTKAEAYGKFVRRTLREDESPDAYVADLQMLAAFSGHMVEDSDEDPMLIEQLIAGLPHVYSKELRLSMAGKKHTVSGCLDMIRALRTASTHAPEVQVAAATPSSRSTMRSWPVRRPTESQSVCFECNTIEHIRRNCPLRQYGRDITCFFFDGRGHVKRDCPQREAWLRSLNVGPSQAVNGQSRNGTVAATKCVGSEELCLCATSAKGLAGLPKIFVDVLPAGAMGLPSTRCRAAVDSCSSRTFVSQKFVTQQSWEVKNSWSSDTIVGLDGRPLPLHGQVCLKIERQDDNVVLPLLTITALVVDDLDVVGAEILVGADVIARSGGVRLQYDDQTLRLNGVYFGEAVEAVAADIADGQDTHPSRHVNVVREDDNVILSTQDGDVRWDAATKGLTMRHTDDGHVYRTSESSLLETQEDETLLEPQLAKRSGSSITEEPKRKSKLRKIRIRLRRRPRVQCRLRSLCRLEKSRFNKRKQQPSDVLTSILQKVVALRLHRRILTHTSANVMKLQRTWLMMKRWRRHERRRKRRKTKFGKYESVNKQVCWERGSGLVEATFDCRWWLCVTPFVTWLKSCLILSVALSARTSQKLWSVSRLKLDSPTISYSSIYPWALPDCLNCNLGGDVVRE